MRAFKRYLIAGLLIWAPLVVTLWVTEYLTGEHISVYVPTTPNPTSGYFLMLPSKDVIALDMTVDTALKYIVSMGVVVPAKPLEGA